MNRLPLPQPEELEVLHRNSTVVTVQGYSAKSMHAYADAETAALRAETDDQQKVIAAYEMCNPPWAQELREQVRVLREALESISNIAARRDVYVIACAALEATR